MSDQPNEPVRMDPLLLGRLFERGFHEQVGRVVRARRPASNTPPEPWFRDAQARAAKRGNLVRVFPARLEIR